MRHLKTFVFAVMIMLGMSATAFAAADTKSTDITYHQQPTITITVPKTITVGQDKKATYTVTIRGDVYANNIVSVVPDRVVVLSDVNGKTDVTATVTQETTEFFAEDINNAGGVSTQGTITADDLTAGDWEGAFNFTITITEKMATPGLYDANENLLCVLTAEDLATDGGTYSAYKSSCYYIVFPKNTTIIGANKFDGFEHVSNIVIPDGVTEIHSYAFSGCWGLQSISIPASVYKLEVRFVEVYTVKNIEFEDPSNWVMIDSWNNKTDISSSSLSDSSSAASYYCGSNWTNVWYHMDSPQTEPGLYDIAWHKIIPITSSEIATDDTSSAGEYKAYAGSTHFIVLPSDTTVIGAYKFYEFSHVTDIIIPDGVTEIHSCAFEYCWGLKSINVPASVYKLEKGFVRVNSGATIDFADNNNWVILSNNNKTYVPSSTLSDAAAAASYYSSNSCNVWYHADNPHVEPGLYDIAWHKIISINAEDVATDDTLGNSIYKDYAQSTWYIVLPSDTTVIGSHKFYNFSHIDSITIPDGVEEIHTGAFDSCFALDKVIIPGSVNLIESTVFMYDCLTNAVFEDTDNWSWKNVGPISSEELSDVSTAGLYLRTTHVCDIWIHE